MQGVEAYGKDENSEEPDPEQIEHGLEMFFSVACRICLQRPKMGTSKTAQIFFKDDKSEFLKLLQVHLHSRPTTIKQHPQNPKPLNPKR